MGKSTPLFGTQHSNSNVQVEIQLHCHFLNKIKANVYGAFAVYQNTKHFTCLFDLIYLTPIAALMNCPHVTDEETDLQRSR